MKIKKYILIIAIISLYNCNYLNNSIENKIIDSYRVCDSLSDCVIDLRTITPFKWDSLYVFNEYDDKEYISQILSLKYNSRDVPDGEDRMIFILKKSNDYP